MCEEESKNKAYKGDCAESTHNMSMFNIWQDHIMAFLQKFGSDLRPNTRGLKVESLRRIIPELLKYLYQPLGDKRYKEKGMWFSRPQDWPEGLYFGDPNNGENKPHKDELIRITKFLLKHFMEREHVTNDQICNYHSAGLPYDVLSPWSEHSDSINSPCPSEYQRKGAKEGLMAQAPMGIQVVDDEDEEKISTGIAMIQQGMESMSLKRKEIPAYLIERIDEMYKGVVALVCNPSKIASGFEPQGACGQPSSLTSEDKNPVQESEGRFRKVSTPAKFDLTYAPNPTTNQFGVPNHIDVEKIHQDFPDLVQIRSPQENQLEPTRKPIMEPGNVIDVDYTASQPNSSRTNEQIVKYTDTHDLDLITGPYRATELQGKQIMDHELPVQVTNITNNVTEGTIQQDVLFNNDSQDLLDAIDVILADVARNQITGMTNRDDEVYRNFTYNSLIVHPNDLGDDYDGGPRKRQKIV